MNAVERLGAAIAKLEQLKADGTLGPWSVDMIPETGECRVIRLFEFLGPHIEEVTGGGSMQPDAELIITLHRTIDVLIETLLQSRGGALATDLALADAILGGNL